MLRSLKALRLFAVFLGILLLIISCKVPRSEIAGRELRRMEVRRGILPAFPRQKLNISQQGPNSVWCDFVSYTLSSLKSDMFLDRGKLMESDKVVLLVDTRENVGHVWTIPWTLNLLGPDWDLQILTSEKSLHFYRRIVDHYGITNAKLDTLEELYGYGPWVPHDFMRRVQFMLASQFWKGIRAEHILVIQDNGVPLRRWDSPEVQELFEEIFRYGYAGAPWSLDEDDERPGGNGGFSYRKRSVLSENSFDLKVDVRDLLSNTTNRSALGAEHEDVILGHLLKAVDFGVAPRYLEHQFACELLFHPKPFGVHNFAPFHDTARTSHLVRMALAEFYGVSDGLQVLELGSTPAQRFEWQTSWLLKLQEIFPNASLPKGFIEWCGA